MCLHCAIQATDLSWDRAHSIVCLDANQYAAEHPRPFGWLDRLNQAFARDRVNLREYMRRDLARRVESAAHYAAHAAGGPQHPARIAALANGLLLREYAARVFGGAAWTAELSIGFSHHVSVNDPFRNLIVPDGAAVPAGERKVDIVHYDPANTPAPAPPAARRFTEGHP